MISFLIFILAFVVHIDASFQMNRIVQAAQKSTGMPHPPAELLEVAHMIETNHEHDIPKAMLAKAAIQAREILNGPRK